MADLSIRPASECRFDVVSLGEVMLRLDPGEGRIRTARSFRAWEGGGEYNVARGLRRQPADLVEVAGPDAVPRHHPRTADSGHRGDAEVLAEVVRTDAVALGEVMLRLDPGEGRIRTARSFRAWEGGGEYNVARGLRRAFGLRTAVVTALADNEVGRLIEDLILAGGVDTSFIRWVPYDGVGRAVRNGLNFTERGFGVRGAVGVSDRT